MTAAKNAFSFSIWSPCLWGHHPHPVIDQCCFCSAFCHLFVVPHISVWFQLGLSFGHMNFLPTVARSMSIFFPSHLTLLPLGIHLHFLLYSQRRLLLSQASLLPHLLDFSHLRIVYSSALRRQCLESGKPWCTPAPEFSWETFLFVPWALWSLLPRFQVLLVLSSCQQRCLTWSLHGHCGQDRCQWLLHSQYPLLCQIKKDIFPSCLSYCLYH